MAKQKGTVRCDCDTLRSWRCPCTFGPTKVYVELLLILVHTFVVARLLLLLEGRAPLKSEDIITLFRNTKSHDSVIRTSIIYSGPTSLDKEVYLENFEFFLKHGLPSSRHDGCDLPIDVFVVLTTETYRHYRDTLRRYNESCGEIQIIIREDKCYDMESARVALVDPRQRFEKVVFVNCGLKGPFSSPQNIRFWTRSFTDRIDERVKLTGITINCGGKLHMHHAHVQSMLWATDKTGLASIIDAGAIYDCGWELSRWHGREELINTYELGLSRAVLRAGYLIQDQLNRTFAWRTATNSECSDLWNDDHLVEKYSPEALVFWKVTRKAQGLALPKWVASVNGDLEKARVY